MTLYRQLLAFTLLLFILLVLGVWLEKLQSTRAFLVDQLASNAQDTATSLGLSLSPVLAEEDLVTAETMVSAIFDRGYYRLIRLADVQGKVLVERRQEVVIEGVPPWFIDLVPLETPVVSALVMAGWSQAGSLHIEGHPGYAYVTLWETAVRITLYFSLACVVVLLLVSVGMRLLLRPLQRVERQAEAICRREYEIQEKLPLTRELRRVVESMNRMTVKVREMFEEQATIAARMRSNAYSDLVTGLGNRRYLQGQVQAGLAAPEAAGGAFLLIHLLGLQEINDQRGYAAGDELLKKAAAVLSESTMAVVNAALARIAGADFALFLPEISRYDAEQIAEEIAVGLGKLAVEQLALSDNIACVGGISYQRPEAFADLLAQADTALQAARQKGPNTWHLNVSGAAGEAGERSKSWWKKTILEVLERKELTLVYQPVVRRQGDRPLLHTETFSRIALPSGELLSAGVFIPLAERLAIISRLDMLVLEKVLAAMAADPSLERLAVNISPASLADRQFRSWLSERLAFGIGRPFCLIFEFVEFAAVQHLEVVREFAETVKRQGHAIGLDHFGQSFANFGYLQSLRPEYVKLDRVYTAELSAAGGDNAFFVSALCSAAHSLDILVIADGVEEEGQLALLAGLNVDGVQGYLIGAPGAPGAPAAPGTPAAGGAPEGNDWLR